MKRSGQKKKVPFWRKVREEKNKENALRLGKLFLLLLFGAIVFKSLKFLIADSRSPLENQKCFGYRTQLANINRVNIVFDQEPLLIVSFDQAEGTLSALAIPEDFYLRKEIEVYRLGSFFELGEMRDGCGGRFLKTELLRFLALPIDRYVKLAGNGGLVGGQVEMEAMVKKVQNWTWPLWAVLNLRAERQGFQTDLASGEIVKLWWRLKKVRGNKVFFRELNRGIALEEDQLVDGTKIEVITSDLFFEEIGGFFKDSSLVQEGIEVAVMNAAGLPGVGQRGGSLVAHLGAELTHVGNWPEKLKANQIWVVDQTAGSTATVKRLADIFQAEVMTPTEVAEPRGELIVLLGQDW